MNDTQASLYNRESLSALVDGQGNTEAVMDAMKGDVWASTREDWNTYQAIGEVLRTPRAAAAKAVYGADPAFVRSVMLRLQYERVLKPDPVVSLDKVTEVAEVVSGTVVNSQHMQAANDTTFRWKLVAGLASFSAVAALAWSLSGVPAAPPEQLATRSTPTERVVPSPEGPMVRDARLEELLSAHKQLGSTSLQVPPGFLRNAGFESANNSRR